MLCRYLKAVLESRPCWRRCVAVAHAWRRSRHVIVMSLYGNDRRYTLGAVRNAQLLPVTFPGWRLWFYCERPTADGGYRYGRVPRRVLDTLVRLGAEIRYVSPSDDGLAPMLWRFTVVDDADVDAFVVRDADSRLTERDAVVVRHWLETTDAVFHCVRDHPSHSRYPISGGLWGARRAVFRAIVNSGNSSRSGGSSGSGDDTDGSTGNGGTVGRGSGSVGGGDVGGTGNSFGVNGGNNGGTAQSESSVAKSDGGGFLADMRRYGDGYVQDMDFLAADVWPKVTGVAHCHDSFSCDLFPSSFPFPVRRNGFEHLGQVYNEFSVGRQVDIDILAAAPVNVKCIPPPPVT